MKRLLIVLLIALPPLIFCQLSPITGGRILNATTAFGAPVAVGTTVHNTSTNQYFFCIANALSTQTLTTAAANFKEIGTCDSIPFRYKSGTVTNKNLNNDVKTHGVDLYVLDDTLSAELAPPLTTPNWGTLKNPWRYNTSPNTIEKYIAGYTSTLTMPGFTSQQNHSYRVTVHLGGISGGSLYIYAFLDTGQKIYSGTTTSIYFHNISQASTLRFIAESAQTFVISSISVMEIQGGAIYNSGTLTSIENIYGHQNLFINKDIITSGVVWAGSHSSDAWTAAFDWGNHSTFGYLTTGLAATTYATIATDISVIKNTCGGNMVIHHISGAVAPEDKTVTYGTVTGVPGEPTKCWTTSNLGASHQATAINDATEASGGWYWQFNRKQGYKSPCSNSEVCTYQPSPAWNNTTNTSASWDIINDPCAIEIGFGWRIPTPTEWTNVDASENWTDWNGPWASLLKLHGAGYISKNDQWLFNRGCRGYYQSSMEYADQWNYLFYFSCWGGSLISTDFKNDGASVRCIKTIEKDTARLSSFTYLKALPPISLVKNINDLEIRVDSTQYLATKYYVGLTYEPKIGVGTTAQFWRGDKSWQTLPATPESLWSRVSGSTNDIYSLNTGGVGIGTSVGVSTNPLNVLNNSTIFGTGGQSPIITETNSDGGASSITSLVSKGTNSAKTAVTTGITLAGVTGRGYDGSNYSTNRIGFNMAAEETWTPTAQGTYFNFKTTAPGTLTFSEKMRITGTGYVGIGTTAPSSILDVLGTLTVKDPAGNGTITTLNGTNGFNNTTGTTQAPAYNMSAYGYEGRFRASRYGGSYANPTALEAGSIIADFGARGWRGSTWSNEVASIWMYSEDVFTATSTPSYIRFNTTPANEVNAYERMRITSTGYIGIGTPLPLYNLDVNGSINTNIAYYGKSDGTGVNVQLETYNGTTGKSAILLKRARGTGASPTLVNSGDMLGHIGCYGAYDVAGVGTFTPSSNAAIMSHAEDDFSDVNHVGSNLSFHTTASATGTRSEKMRITAAGKVGIGTTAPLSMLHVYSTATGGGTIAITNDNAANGGAGGAAFSMNDIPGTSNWFFKATSGGFKIRDHTNGLDVIQIEKNSIQNAIYIKAGGNIGIGTTDPYYKLDVLSSGVSAINGTSTHATGGGVSGSGYIGVFGLGSAHGVSGLSTTGNGVAGQTSSGSGGYFSSTTGPGITATSTSGYAAIFSDGNIGMGTGSPTSKLHVVGTMNVTGKTILGDTSTISCEFMNVAKQFIATQNVGMRLQTYNYGSNLTFIRFNGTLRTPTKVLAENPIMNIAARGYDGSVESTARGYLQFYSPEDWTTTSHPTYFKMGTTPSGTVAAVERMRITSTGYIGIGTTAPTANIHIAKADGGTGITLDGYWDNSWTSNKTIASIKMNNTYDGNYGYLVMRKEADHTSKFLLTSYLAGSNYWAEIFTYNLDTKLTTLSNMAGMTTTINPSGGNVGIGNATPLVKLHVTGAVMMDGTDTTGVGSSTKVGTMQYYNGHFYGLVPGSPPTWKQLDN